MLFKQLNIKIFFALISIIGAFNANFNTCFAAGSPTGFAAIWRAADDISRKTAAVACFDAIAALDRTVKNVTKHAPKHMVVPSELKGKLKRSLLCWLSYPGWEDSRMEALRKLLSGLYITGNDINKIRQWVSGNDGTPTVRAAFKNICKFAQLLKKNAGVITDGGVTLHTYSIDGHDPVDHSTEDNLVITQFNQFFTNLPQGVINDAYVNQLLTEDPATIRQKLTRLLFLQRNLFDRMNLMTGKLLSECFEPCMRAALKNAFHLQGVMQGVDVIGAFVQVGELADNISVNDYSEQGATPAIPELPLANVGGNPPEAIPLAEISAELAMATTVLKRTFHTGAAFTQFVRAVVLATNEGSPQAFVDLADGVIRVDNIVALPDSTEEKSTTLLSVIKAARGGEAVEGDIANDVTTYVTPKTPKVSRRIIADPFITTIYTGDT